MTEAAEVNIMGEAMQADELEVLRARASELEQALQRVREEGLGRLLQAELRTAAVRAGMVDLDGLKLVDASRLELTEAGELADGAAVMEQLRGDKPWLFARASSSSRANAPPSAPQRRKLATEMTVDEWRAARAEMLRRL